MAYFRKRGEKWSFTADIGQDAATGKRKQKTVSGFKTKKEAQLAAGKLEQEVNHGTYIEEKNLTFEDFSIEWLKLYCDNVKESSARARRYEIDCLAFYFRNIKLKNITKKTYHDTLIDLKDRGYSDNTISGIHGTARMFFKKAMELDVIKLDPTAYARPPRSQRAIDEDDAPAKYLEKDELNVFLKTAKEKGLDGDYLIFMTLAYSGMRIGELCGLKWTDVDFEAHTINIIKTYYNPKNITTEYLLQTPKTKSSKRCIDIDIDVINELKKHQEQQDIIKNRIGDSYYDKNFIFAKIKNNPGYPHYLKFIEIRMSRLLKIAGLAKELTPHSLRHTHTSLLAEAGVGLQQIMERLGHIDDSTTKNVYMHVTKTMKKEASQKFSELMRNL
ncbi:site-specific integrase [Pelosinus propionicus]|uniref:Site-specific recombinase XerD n=1 Tax=Pelosinus propionicus DSM 13327 TaxID=1123291 RepID=A0A1I4QK94_9FIRM|nr:site-specific integrase [Pelosinus propionicus]SFM40481.1 Site-specific recombinase XerD [Pelosinus propionicus DSM 13327]